MIQLRKRASIGSISKSPRFRFDAVLTKGGKGPIYTGQGSASMQSERLYITLRGPFSATLADGTDVT
ncbi:hypothetical protein, partial [uncultured Paracoccus sp.]|uniref:hypothetical protein n=1 Tax=uncultured Paracoccus sp. TaxID=189685 RepID=UPI00260399B3